MPTSVVAIASIAAATATVGSAVMGMVNKPKAPTPSDPNVAIKAATDEQNSLAAQNKAAAAIRTPSTTTNTGGAMGLGDSGTSVKTSLLGGGGV